MPSPQNDLKWWILVSYYNKIHECISPYQLFCLSMEQLSNSTTQLNYIHAMCFSCFICHYYKFSNHTHSILISASFSNSCSCFLSSASISSGSLRCPGSGGGGGIYFSWNSTGLSSAGTSTVETGWYVKFKI